MITLLLFACAARPAPPGSAAAAPPAPHGTAVLAARDALVNTDLPRFTQAIARLRAELPLAGAAANDQAPLQAALERAAAAGSAAEAGVALGEVGMACGGCHAAVGATLHAPEAPASPGDGVRAEMARHDQALALMWSGLVRPSDDDLRAGAEAFSSSSLSTISGELAPAAAALDEAVNGLAAALATNREARAARFGALVNTCAACHTAPPGGLSGEPD